MHHKSNNKLGYMKRTKQLRELFVKIYHDLIDILYAESHLRKR